jgi:hypothetical protein
VPVFTLEDFRLPERLPVTVPSEWARRRPDIQAPKRRCGPHMAIWALPSRGNTPSSP